jgi:signal peptidase I
MPDQYVLVDKITPHFNDFHRSDIVVFNPPAGWVVDAAGSPFVKRVVGIGGDTVDIHGGHVYVNGTELIEPYLFENQTTELPDGSSKKWRLAGDQLFVMGDHRQDSRDSREFGPIAKSSVIGRAWLRYWPLSEFGLVSQPKRSPIPSGSPAASPAASKAP